jgi:alkylation response protein AidB-like acyl-CoA dehydrogenase
MDFALNEEQIMIKTSAREFLDRECQKKFVRQMADDEKGYSPELWAKMADLGWQGLAIPEKYGGAGIGFLDLVVLMEEMGRALVPGPFLPTVVFAGRPILHYGTEEQKKQFLPEIAQGKMILTLALMEPNGSLEASGITVKATPEGSNFVIDGTKLFVRDAHIADYILTVTRTHSTGNKEDGITLFLIDAKSPGIQIKTLQTMTGEKQCEVIFNKVGIPRSAMLGTLNHGWPIVQKLMTESAVAECAWMLGGARWVLDTTIEYAKTRIQFGVPIGIFQANQHKLANMSIEVEGATSITYYAAWAIMENDPNAVMAASLAKAWCSDAYKHATFEGVQIHGGIGFTWDHDMHLYLKRAKTAEISFGDGNYHREKVAQLLDL